MSLLHWIWLRVRRSCCRSGADADQISLSSTVVDGSGVGTHHRSLLSSSAAGLSVSSSAVGSSVCSWCSL